MDLKLTQARLDPLVVSAVEAELDPILQAAGVSHVRGSFFRDSGTEGQVWLATDLGLLIGSCRLRPLPEDAIRSGGWNVELCPWADVVNPELSIETVAIGMQVHIRVHLLVQLPRVDLVSDGQDLAALVAAIMLAKP